LQTGRATQIDTRDGVVVAEVPARSTAPSPEGPRQVQTSRYGLAIDHRDNVWFGQINNRDDVGGAGQAVIEWIDGRTHESRMIALSRRGRTRGVAVDFDGNIWAGDDEGNTLYKLSPGGLELGAFPTGDGGRYDDHGPHGIGIDTDGKVWGISGDRASRYDIDGRLLCRTHRLPALYTYSDMTGLQLLTVTVRAGRWKVRFEGGGPDVHWDRVTWDGATPAGASIAARVRVAAAAEALDEAPWSPRLQPDRPLPPADPATGYSPSGRWIEVELSLDHQIDDVLPLLRSVRVEWQRP